MHIPQYLKKLRQLNNQIWPVNRIWHEKHSSWKIIHKIWWRNYPGAFIKKIKIEYICGSIVQGFIQFIFTVWQVEGNWNIFKLSWKTLAFTLYKAFLKNEKRSGTSPTASFSAWFLKKNVSLLIFYELAKFHCLIAFTSWEIERYVYCNCLFPML